MTQTSAPDGPVIIKKYGNRRLYDTRKSGYITLDDLAAIVQSGATVRVVEASSDRDLTRQVLTQVILEQQDALDIFPVELLHAVIRVRGTLEQAPFAAFLSAMTGQFVQRGNLWAKQLVDLMGSFRMGTMPGFAGAAAPAEPAATQPSPPPDAANGADDGAPAPPAPGAEDLQGVRSRMSALLDKMKKG